MHEVSLLQDALELALAEAKREGTSRIHRIGLRVGALSGVVPEALEFAFEVVTRGSLAEGARLDVTVVPAAGRCSHCGETFSVEESGFMCPTCGAPAQIGEQSFELQLATLEVS